MLALHYLFRLGVNNTLGWFFYLFKSSWTFFPELFSTLMKGEYPNLWLIWKREQIGEWIELFLQHNKQKFTNLYRRNCLIILLFLMQLVLNCICRIKCTGKNHMRWAHYIHLPIRKGSGICIPYQICHARDWTCACMAGNQSAFHITNVLVHTHLFGL